jgi:dTMP kinase
MLNNSIFIAFEGIDGSGKSTQARNLAQKLISKGYKVYTTFEPTDSPIGSVIRSIMKGRIAADHKTIAGLFVADRLDHLLNGVNGIMKKLEEGFIVISDRYYFSSYAYHGTHMDMDWVIAANSMSAGILRPNLNIFIDVSPEVSLHRINNSRGEIELYETLDNLNMVREMYLKAFEKLNDVEQIVLLDGDQEKEQIATAIWEEVEKVLEKCEL